MADEVQVLQLEVEISHYAQDMSKLVSATKKADASLAALLATVAQVRKTLGALGSNVNIKITADTGDLDKVESEVSALDGLTPDIIVTVDDSELRSIDDLIGTIDGEKPKVKVSTDDSEVDTTKRKVEDLGETVDVKINANDAELNDVIEKLETANRLATIELVLNAKEALSGLKEFVTNLPGVSTISDLNSAVRTFTAQTGQEFEGIGTIIDNIFINNLGESREEIAKVTAQLAQLKVPFEDLEEAAVSAFNVQAVTGFDLNDIIRTQEQLVTNFKISYKEAGDLIVSGFQQGGDQADDFLDTLTEYAPVLKDLGFNANSTLGLIVSGLEQGVFNADKLGDVFKELGIRIEEAITSREGATYDALVKLGLVDEAQALQAGEITGAAFATAAIDAVKAGKGGEFDLVEIFGTPLEDLGESFFNIDFSAIGETVIPQDAAQDAADELFSTLDNALTEFTRTVEVELANSFRIGGKPLIDLIEQARVDIQELADLLQGGTDFPEAFEVAFSVPGFSESVNDFIVGMGNVVIDFEIALASVLDFLGQGDAAKSLRSDAANRAETQLAFDLQFADTEEEIQEAVERAFNRGVDNAGISESVNGAVNEALGAGKFDQAQSIIDAVAIDQVIAKISAGAFSQTATFTNPEFTGQTDEQIVTQLTEAGQEQGLQGTTVEIVGRLSVDTEQAQAEIDQTIARLNPEPIKAKTDFLLDDSDIAGGNLPQPLQSGEQIAPAFEGLPQVQEEIAKTTEEIGKFGSSYIEVRDTVTTANEEIVGVIGETVTTTDNLGETGADGVIIYGGTTQQTAAEIIASWLSVIDVINDTAAAAAEASSAATPLVVPPSGKTTPTRAGGGDVGAGQFFTAGESGTELLYMPRAGHVYDPAQSHAIMEGLSALSLANMGNSDNRAYNYNINQSFIAQGGAQAVSQAAVVARKIRGV